MHNTHIKYATAIGLYDELDGFEHLPHTKVVLLEDYNRVLNGYRDLFGQVMQAKKGFGLYNKSPTMDAAVKTANEIIFGQSNDTTKI